MHLFAAQVCLKICGRVEVRQVFHSASRSRHSIGGYLSGLQHSVCRAHTTLLYLHTCSHHLPCRVQQEGIRACAVHPVHAFYDALSPYLGQNSSSRGIGVQIEHSAVAILGHEVFGLVLKGAIGCGVPCPNHRPCRLLVKLAQLCDHGHISLQAFQSSLQIHGAVVCVGTVPYRIIDDEQSLGMSAHQSFYHGAQVLIVHLWCSLVSLVRIVSSQHDTEYQHSGMTLLQGGGSLVGIAK